MQTSTHRVRHILIGLLVVLLIAGSSQARPSGITGDEAEGGTDVAITKYDTSGTQRINSTYLGGGMDELPHSMIVNSVNELFVF